MTLFFAYQTSQQSTNCLRQFVYLETMRSSRLRETKKIRRIGQSMIRRVLIFPLFEAVSSDNCSEKYERLKYVILQYFRY